MCHSKSIIQKIKTSQLAYFAILAPAGINKVYVQVCLTSENGVLPLGGGGEAIVKKESITTTKKKNILKMPIHGKQFLNPPQRGVSPKRI